MLTSRGVTAGGGSTFFLQMGKKNQGELSVRSTYLGVAVGEDVTGSSKEHVFTRLAYDF